MKNKTRKSIILVLLIILLTTGCGKSSYIVTKKGKPVTSEGQNLQTHIFCQPSKGSKMYKLYEKYEDQMVVKLNKLPKCENFKITSNKTKSLWQFLFVKPLAYLILKLGALFKSWGMTKAYLALSLIIIGLLIRLIILPFNIKTQKQSKKMQELMPEMQKIERKYANRTDQEAMMMKSQETMALYKKYKVSPLLSCILALIQLPIFFAFLQAIYKIPTIYEGELFGLGLGITPKVGIFTYHNYLYIVLVVLILLTTYFSFKYTMSQSNANSSVPGAGNQMRTMLIVMTILITFASFSLPTAIALYWIVTYAFIIIQTFTMNLIDKKKKNKKTKEKTSKKKDIKGKLKEKEGLKYGKNS